MPGRRAFYTFEGFVLCHICKLRKQPFPPTSLCHLCRLRFRAYRCALNEQYNAFADAAAASGHEPQSADFALRWEGGLWSSYAYRHASQTSATQRPNGPSGDIFAVGGSRANSPAPRPAPKPPTTAEMIRDADFDIANAQAELQNLKPACRGIPHPYIQGWGPTPNASRTKPNPGEAAMLTPLPTPPSIPSSPTPPTGQKTPGSSTEDPLRVPYREKVRRLEDLERELHRCKPVRGEGGKRWYRSQIVIRRVTGDHKRWGIRKPAAPRGQTERASSAGLF